jgi:hypothetical protein
MKSKEFIPPKHSGHHSPIASPKDSDKKIKDAEKIIKDLIKEIKPRG